MKHYGLIGKKLSYSYSKLIHDYLIKEFKLEAKYELVETAILSRQLLEGYDGLNVTIPYKEAVLSYLDSNDDKMPVNTIVNHKGKLYGYNTDIDGFTYLLNKLNLNIEEVTSVVVLGSGASSKMIQQYFKDKKVVVISRKDKYFNYDLIPNLKADLLINATPVGMNEERSPITERYLTNFKAVIDLNYNPMNSKLALASRKHNLEFIGGLDMLIVQALKAFELWHEIKVSNELIGKVRKYLLTKIQPKVAIIGLSLSGKSTIVRKFQGLDLDDYLEEENRQTIAEMIENQTFRDKETIALAEAIDNGSQLIACGGGIILKHENMELLKDYLIIHLKEDINVLIERLNNEVRPLLKDKTDLIEMAESRRNSYSKYANLELNYTELEDFLNEVSNC
jgi:shikimate dehydrogenase